MVRAYHVVFSCYGFWLPNDPRGSWSDWIRSWELLRYGGATKTKARRSVAHHKHDAEQRRAAKQALKHPPVVFDGVQARAVARGFAEADYSIAACSIMPDHVHLVVQRHDRQIEQIVRHLKARATQQLNSENLASDSPTPWARGTGWRVYLNTDADLRRSIDYVKQNPPREGLKQQRWGFITPTAV